MDRSFEFPATSRSRIVVGSGIAAHLPEFVAGLADDGVVVVHDASVRGLAVEHAQRLRARACLQLPGGAAQKRLHLAGELASALQQAGASRGTALVAFGGGTITDLGGFVAAIYRRGMPFVACPTTSLAMCDAALGGKNGVDHDGLKNQLGTIHQPELICADVDWLDTLPGPQFREGFVEAIKKAAVLDATCFAALEELAPHLAARERTAALAAVEMAVAMKMAVVQADEREADRRMALNFGHTIGHALESLSNEQLRHGHAVAIGMLAECRAAGVDGAVVGRLAAWLQRLGIDTTVPAELARPDALWTRAQHDKKARRGSVPMLVPAELGTVRRVELTLARLQRALG
ncbi:MAG: 3-dehydroquinate synthase [Planctomycetes bacterium]|nr:3-dehydroquinate synthase [Planctomycetota bacterium]